jgi:hypothetical protein
VPDAEAALLTRLCCAEETASVSAHRRSGRRLVNWGSIVRKLHHLAKIAAPALLFGVLGVGATAAPAQALTVNHVRASNPIDETIPAGDICSFAIHVTGVESVRVEDFRDDEGHFVKVNLHFTNTVTISANGQSLTQTTRFNEFDVGFNGGGAPTQVITAGLFEHIRLPDGRVIVIAAGRVVFDVTTDMVTFEAGNLISRGENAALCAALS